MLIDVELEEWNRSAVIRRVRSDYERKPADGFRDEAADLTSRQAVFYRNLIRIAEKIQSGEIPVDFQSGAGERFYLDRGCIKIAEHAGFIRPLVNDESGVVSTIMLAFAVTRSG